MVPLINRNKNSTYLVLWKRVCLNIETKKEYHSVLHTFELLLVIPFKNAKLERMFSRMLRVKTNWRNRLNRQHFDTLLCIGQEGRTIGEFDPNDAMNLWFSDKVCCLIASQHKSCSEKRQKVNENQHVDIATLAMSYLEDGDVGFQGFN